jgi:hypothetical protein
VDKHEVLEIEKVIRFEKGVCPQYLREENVKHMLLKCQF